MTVAISQAGPAEMLTGDSPPDAEEAQPLYRDFVDHIRYSRGKTPKNATPYDQFVALALAVRDRLASRWVATQRVYYEKDVKRAYYLSAEYLPGRTLGNNLIALGLLETARNVFKEAGADLDALLEMEPDPGLGNGGLGRLAACFLDSMASLSLPGFGYGIRYEYGIFEQRIENGEQIERGDQWLRYGNPWEVPRYDLMVNVSFYGRVEKYTENGVERSRWVDAKHVVAVPYDLPVAGFRNGTVN